MKTDYSFIPALILSFLFSLGACNANEGTEVAQEVEEEAVEIGTAEVEDVERSLLDVLRSQENLSTFLSLVESADLATALATTDNYTIFAPTNEAFNQLPAGTLEQIRNLPTQELANIVSHHMMSRRLTQDEVQQSAVVDVLDGLEIPVKSVDGVTMIGEARVVTPAIPARNGVIHTIDQVLIPENTRPQE